MIDLINYDFIKAESLYGGKGLLMKRIATPFPGQAEDQPKLQSVPGTRVAYARS